LERVTVRLTDEQWAKPCVPLWLWAHASLALDTVVCIRSCLIRSVTWFLRSAILEQWSRAFRASIYLRKERRTHTDAWGSFRGDPSSCHVAFHGPEHHHQRKQFPKKLKRSWKCSRTWIPPITHGSILMGKIGAMEAALKRENKLETGLAMGRTARLLAKFRHRLPSPAILWDYRLGPS
jgi:hypothetical protein